MGAAAALHVAPTSHTAPVKKTGTKRKGGGGGATFAKIAHRVYQDERADAQARRLLLAVAYALTMAPRDEETTMWRAVRNALAPSTPLDGLRSLVREDVPRYEPPRRRWPGGGMEGLCSGPRVRAHPDGPDDFRNRLKVCGESAQMKVVERDPVTGWHTNHWFCKRHRAHAERVREQVREQNEKAPPPIPNRGGLMPSYFNADADGWVDLYRWALRHEGWEPPYHGLRADDWPVPGRDPVPARPRLRLIALTSLEDEGEK